MSNLYEILELDSTASQEDIRKSFRRLAAVHHPDRNPGNDQSVQKFKTINDAYQVLSDDKKRSEYDLALNLQNKHNRSSAAADYQSMMDNLYDTFTNKKTVDFGFSVKTSTRPHNPGDDITIELFISLDESIAGCKKTVKTKSPRPSVLCSVCHGLGSQPGTRRTTCNSCAGHGRHIDTSRGGINVRQCIVCRGIGTVSLANCRNCSGTGKSHYERELTITIPAGINDGQQLRLHGIGSPGEPAGDLYISIKIKPNDIFRRDKFDIHASQVIDLNKAIFGGPCSFNGPNNQTIQIEIPPGTQPGDLILVRGAGVQNPNDRIRGNMIVHVNIRLPKVMSNRAKKLWIELIEELGDYNQS